MRHATRVLVVLALLALPSASWAKRPEPMPCPLDIATALEDACPCAGKTNPSDGSVTPWRNHGQYVSCVVRLRNALRRSGCLTDDTVRRSIARCAARSTCGKSGAVLCCVSEAGTCNDPTPDDGVPGMCSNDDDLSCVTDADCVKTRAGLARDEAACTDRGGTAVGPGSVCQGCPPPAP